MAWGSLWNVHTIRQALQVLIGTLTYAGLQAHADNLTVQSYQTPSQPVQAQVAVKAQSLATHAQSLEAQAEAQNLQAQAQVHAHAQAEAQAQAQHLAAQAQAHAQAQAQANAHASQLKSAASFGESLHSQAQNCAESTDSWALLKPELI